MSEAACLIQEVDVGVPLDASELLVLGEGPRVELLVGGDDVDASPHPLQVVLRRHIAGGGIDDHCVGHIARRQVIPEPRQVCRLALTARHMTKISTGSQADHVL